MLWFSVARFWCKKSGDVSFYVCSYHFSSVWVAELERAAYSLDHGICSLCILTICNLGYFTFWL